MSSEQVLALPVSSTLASALALVQAHCQTCGIETRYLARPEIFTHGMPASWLRQRLTDFTEHLCITDGSTVKHLEFCRTSIFLYRLAQHDSYVSFWRLQRRAPELLQQVHGQLNTCFAWGEADLRTHPTPFYLKATDPRPPPPAVAYPFLYRPYQPEETAQRALAAEPRQVDMIASRLTTIYVPFTETSLFDKAFARAAAFQIRDSFYRPDTTLLLRLPNEQPGETLVSRTACVLRGLAASGVVLPRNSPPNIFFLTSDLNLIDIPENFKIVLHESFEFWKNSNHFYQKANLIEVLANTECRSNPEILPLDVTSIFGSNAQRVWLEPTRRDDRV